MKKKPFSLSFLLLFLLGGLSQISGEGLIAATSSQEPSGMSRPSSRSRSLKEKEQAHEDQDDVGEEEDEEEE
jgi:hypothetical protein